MTDLIWIRHRYGGHTAPIPGGHYLVQADWIRNETHYTARLVQSGPQIWLGCYPTRLQAERACHDHHTTLKGATA